MGSSSSTRKGISICWLEKWPGAGSSSSPRIPAPLIVSERASLLGFEGYGEGESADKALRDRIHSIVTELDPLEAEKAVLSIYFDFLSSREGGSPFSTEALMIYALKLQLIGRASSFSQEKGSAEFDRLYRTIEADIFR